MHSIQTTEQLRVTAQNVREQVIGPAARAQYQGRVIKFKSFLSALDPPQVIEMNDGDTPSFITIFITQQCVAGNLKYDVADAIRNALVHYYKHILNVVDSGNYI